MPSPRVPGSPSHSVSSAECLPRSQERPRFRAYGSGVPIPGPARVSRFAGPLCDLLLQTHLADPLRRNLQRGAGFGRIAEGVALHPEIFLRQLVDEVVRSLGRDIDDTAANAGEPPGIGRIDNVDSHTWITPHIACL